ncbi:MAG: Lrp/AsnC family transcriptional regulator [Syntrophomonadaceae bacterium]
MRLDHKDIEILKYIQTDLSLESNPFKTLADRIGLSEEDIVLRIKTLKSKGVLRRFGAVLRHQKAGFTENAMVAWKVGSEQCDEIGGIMAQFDEISHCYLREVPPDFDYNLFTMIHARTADELNRIIDKVSMQTGLTDYKVLKSVRELKKESMVYFT